MNLIVFIVVLFLLQGACLVIARQVSKGLSDQADYFLAGRNVHFFPLTMTLIATQIGGGLILGSAEEAYHYGWYVLLYPLGASVGLAVLALGVGRRLAQFNVPTIAQLLETVYGSINLKRIASLLSITSLFMILIAQFIASKKFMLSIGVEQTWVFIAIWGLVILYTVTGGLKAVVATDILQALFFIFVFLICFAYTYFASPIPFAEILNSGSGSGFEFNQEKLLGWFLMPLFFMVIEQDMAQRCFAAKSGNVVSWAAGCTAVCVLIICAIPVYYGIEARMLGLESTGSSILMNVVSKTATPGITAFVACAILAAIISTADSLINAIGSNISQDFVLRHQREGLSEVRISKGITALIGCSALFISLYFDNVVDMLILSYDLSVSCVFIPVFAALFPGRKSMWSAMLAVVFGGVSFIIFRLLPPPLIPKELASLGMSLIGYLLGSFLSNQVNADAR